MTCCCPFLKMCPKYLAISDSLSYMSGNQGEEVHTEDNSQANHSSRCWCAWTGRPCRLAVESRCRVQVHPKLPGLFQQICRPKTTQVQDCR